jgi:hypothetical protein
MPSTSIDRVTGISTSIAVKAPVKAATTANITLSGLQTIDGVVLVAGNRVLVKNQTTSAQNGIYYASATTWTRTEDCDGSDDLLTGTVVFVNTGGSSNGLNWFQASCAVEPPLIGTTAITWTKIYVSLTTVSSATETLAGVAELATQAEVNTGTDDARIVTPLKMAVYVAAQALSIANTAIATALAAAKTIAGLWTFTHTKSTVVTLTDAATIAWDVSAGNAAKVTLTASGHTVGAPTNIQTGGFYFLSLIQDGTGSRTVSWNAAFNFGTASTPTLTTTASKTDTFTFYSSNGTSLYCVGKAQGF